jgi:spore germination cell wall hydrolase CwlJ-like protein
MRFRQLVFGFALIIMAFPVWAKEYDAAAPTVAAANDLRRLPASSVIPAIRQESSLKHDQILCLALAMYHEARGESEAERLAVAEVVYNRAVHTDSTICGTVWADHGSQFQWVKSSDKIVPREFAVWQAVQFSALRFARHRPPDSTHGATNFYNPLLCSPDWANEGQVTVSLRQVFLRIDGKYTRSTGKVSGTDPISQVDKMGRLAPTRSYAGGKS